MRSRQEGAWLVQILRVRVWRMLVCLVRVRWVWGRQMWVWQEMRVWQAPVRACLVWVWLVWSGHEQTRQERTGREQTGQE